MMDNLNIRCLRVSKGGTIRGVYELAKDKRGYFWGLLDIEPYHPDIASNKYPKIKRELIAIIRGGYMGYFDFNEVEYLEAVKKCGNNSNS